VPSLPDIILPIGQVWGAPSIDVKEKEITLDARVHPELSMTDQMTMRFSNKVCLVAGAGSGIGKAGRLEILP
jgi:hypothetical protein